MQYPPNLNGTDIAQSAICELPERHQRRYRIGIILFRVIFCQCALQRFCWMIIKFLWVQPVFGTRLAVFHSGKNLLDWASKMSVSIDRMINKAEKSAKSGDFAAAIMTCIDALETYPENPRLQALAKRLSKPQITKQQVKDLENAALPKVIIDELQDLVNSQEWTLLAKRCLDLIQHHDNSAELWNYLGCAHAKQGYPRLAETAFRKSIANDPSYFAGYTNLGNALLDLDKFDEALEVHNTAAKLNPSLAETQNNLGAVYETLARYEEAFECYSKAMSLDPNYATAVYNLAGIQLRMKNFVEGWSLREARWIKETNDGWKPYIQTSRPLWDGSNVERLYIWAEQGVGDEIMFASCFHDLLEKCNQLTVACSPRLISLFSRSFDDRIRFVSAEDGLPDDQFDCHAPALTATGLVRHEVEDFNSASQPYLHADPIWVQSVRDNLEQASGGKPIVGVSWMSKNKRYGRHRSISLTELVAAIPEDYFIINLQYGEVMADLRAVETNLGRGVSTFDDIDNFSHLDKFAALISACDSVVSIDNSTVHFAGALSKACHVLLHHSPDWRWGDNSETQSYWYQSLSLHRQHKLNDWTGSLQSLRSALNKNSPG